LTAGSCNGNLLFLREVRTEVLAYFPYFEKIKEGF
jgi:hypothetical protein